MADVNVSVGRADFPELCWELDPACLTEEWEALTQEIKNRSAMLAIGSLRVLTAQRVGGCPITVRPCAPQSCAPQSLQPQWNGAGPFFPMNWGGRWTNCGCSGNCGCSATCEIDLPAPVGDLIEVKSDGVVVPLTDFRVDNGHILVYQGSGECPFNLAQDLSLPDTEAGTFSITYVNSYPVDAIGSYAAGVLAMEFAKACTGGKCRLPNNVTSLTRNGASFEIVTGAFPDGFTGIREVDSWIAQWKPAGSPAFQPVVYSPDLPQMRHTTRTFT